MGGSGDYGARTTYSISGNGRTVVLWNTWDGCIPVQIETNEIALEAEQGESKLPGDEDWATTSSGSTHTSDYTWTERTDDRSSGEDSVPSGGSAYSAKYTEEGEVSRTGPMLRGNIPTLHAFGIIRFGWRKLLTKGNRQKKTRKLVKAHLLNEATLGELKFGVELTKRSTITSKTNADVTQPVLCADIK